jgi:hypothetical protein
MQYLAWACSIVSLVCWIMTLVKMFTDKEKGGVLHGIIGIVTCGIWALIWGWMNAARLNYQKVMLIWTIAFAAGLICNFVFVGAAMTKTQ